MKRKISVVLLGIVVAVLISFILVTVGKKRVMFVDIDANGTQIQASYEKEVHPLSFLGQYVHHHRGYVLVNNSFLGWINQKKFIVSFKPKNSSKNLKSQVKNSRYVAAAFQDVNLKAKNGNLNLVKSPYEKARLRIITSNDGVHWQRLATNYPNMLVRDPDMMKYKKYYYIAYTVGLMRTKDFKHWEKIDWNPQVDNATVWAPSFIQSTDGKYYIIASKRPAGQENFETVFYQFNPSSGQVEMKPKVVSDSDLPANIIDCRITVVNGTFFLWYKDVQNQQIRYAVSNNLTSGYKVQPGLTVNYKNGWSYEGADVDASNNYLNGLPKKLYFDVYNSKKRYYGVHWTSYNVELRSWSKYRPIKADFLVRHFGIMTLR